MDTNTIKAAKFEGMSIFRPALCNELSGKSFSLVMDDGYDYELCFYDRQVLTYGRVGDAPRSYAYDCLKPEERTYFINIEEPNLHPRTGITLILDIEQSLVTAMTAQLGRDPKFPRMPTTQITFGAIRREDGTVPHIRHGYTTDLCGKAIDWCYGTFNIVHVYSSERYYRVTFTPEEIKRRFTGIPTQGERKQTGEVPVYEDLAAYIKIKDGLYAVSLLETILCRRNGHGNSLFFLMNLKTMHDVGRSFGTNNEGNDENYTFGAFGNYFDASETLAKPSSYYIR